MLLRKPPSHAEWMFPLSICRSAVFGGGVVLGALDSAAQEPGVSLTEHAETHMPRQALGFNLQTSLHCTWFLVGVSDERKHGRDVELVGGEAFVCVCMYVHVCVHVYCKYI